MSETSAPLGITTKTSGEIASAAATAHSKALIEAKYIMAIQRPRNLLAVRDKILDACARPGFAESAWYAKPVGKDKVRGPSIRFAETAVQCMTNITVMPTIVYEDAEKLVLDVQVIDLETNTSYGDQVTLAKTVERKDKRGREVVGERINTYGDPVFIVVATEDEMANKVNSAKSKIIRNSSLRLIPQDLIEEAQWAVKDTLEKGGGDPAEAMKRIADSFSSLGIKPEELEKYLGHPLASVSPAERQDLREVHQTLKDGEAKWSDYVEGGQRKTPAKAARVEPLNPFTAAPESSPMPEPEQQAEPVKQEESNEFLDMRTKIQEATTPGDLTDCASKLNDIKSDVEYAIAKDAIKAKAKALKCKWDATVSGYKATA